jgi:carboxypeptidase PM20D1
LLLLPGTPLEPTLSELVPDAVWSDLGLERVVDEPHPPSPGSPLDHPAYLEIQDLIRRQIEAVDPGAPHGPAFLTTAATDARFARALGVAAYGFSPFFASSMESLMVGQRNERLSLPAFVQGVDMYRTLVLSLSGLSDTNRQER